MSSRRRFLGCAAGTAGLFAPALLLGRRNGGALKAPNIVLILADDLGYGDVGCYNPESKIPTPRLDRFAAQGVRFTDAHTPSGVCSPTRYGLLTGRYPWRSRLKTLVMWPWDEPLIERGRLTLPGMLKRAGYRTACIGKWHLGWDWATSDGSRINSQVGLGVAARDLRNQFANKIDFSKPVRGGPTEFGFDTYFGDDVPNFPPYTWIENDRILRPPSVQKPKEMYGWPGMMAPGWRLEAVMPELARRAAGFVEESAKSRAPFFLYFALTAPHEPVAPDERFRGRSKAGPYGDFVNQVDASVGAVLDALGRAKVENDTLVIFTSDNGPENPAYQRLRDYGHSSMGPWRGLKRMLWEGGHRVPFLARWPGRIAAGRVEDEVICLTDCMATVAGMLGAPLPAGAAEDSYDIGSALFGRKRSGPIREATVHYSMDGQYAIRQGDWVFLDSTDGGGGRAEPEWWRRERHVEPCNAAGELFHLKNDPSQKRNLYREHPDKVRVLAGLLEKYKREERSVRR